MPESALPQVSGSSTPALDRRQRAGTVGHQLLPRRVQSAARIDRSHPAKRSQLYNLLFRAVAETLIQVAVNPKHLGAEIGFFGILHTWGQNLLFHPHIHCVVPAGGLAPGRTRWIKGSDR